MEVGRATGIRKLGTDIGDDDGLQAYHFHYEIPSLKNRFQVSNTFRARLCSSG